MEYYNMFESGARIRMLRKSNGLTQSDLADRIGISVSMMKKVETGTKGLSIDLLVALSYCLNTSFEYIILGHNTQITHYSKNEHAKQYLTHISQELLALASTL